MNAIAWNGKTVYRFPVNEAKRGLDCFKSMSRSISTFKKKTLGEKKVVVGHGNTCLRRTGGIENHRSQCPTRWTGTATGTATATGTSLVSQKSKQNISGASIDARPYTDPSQPENTKGSASELVIAMRAEFAILAKQSIEADRTHGSVASLPNNRSYRIIALWAPTWGSIRFVRITWAMELRQTATA